ncbi:hypothetical protein ACMXYX_17765 (plasmid) [Neptuniibacter sp. QD72_48]|uniref:hypothetical protein n=1 Tax=Neptuniibacter sp. QD72_48 TaxID=3398214 RepID=UPI0039F603A4
MIEITDEDRAIYQRMINKNPNAKTYTFDEIVEELHDEFLNGMNEHQAQALLDNAPTEEDRQTLLNSHFREIPETVKKALVRNRFKYSEEELIDGEAFFKRL